MAIRLSYFLLACAGMSVFLLLAFRSVIDDTSSTSTHGERVDLPREHHHREISTCVCKNHSRLSQDGDHGPSTQPNEPLEAIDEPKGYMLAFRYYEQQTQATRNLLQLQCLADSFGMKVVEPFVSRSSFTIPFNEFSSNTPPTDHLRFGDLIDVDLWDRQTAQRYGYQPLATWNNFLNHAPKDVIIHCIRYRNPPRIPAPAPGANYRHGCPSECFSKFNHSLHYLREFGFKLVRKSCSSFVDYAGSVSTSSFLENLLGKHKASEVTVLLNEFRGIFGLYRMSLLSECGIKHSSVDLSVMPSVRIQKDAHRYSKELFNNRPYVAILARIERVVFQLHHKIESCVAEVRSLLKKLSTSHKLFNSFLAMDVGRFGSSGAALKNLQPHGEALFQGIYQERWSFGEWEDTFERLSSRNNSAYVANLQRTIAAKGRCLIMVGAGGFQAQARALYEQLHPDTDSWCVFKVCSEENRL